MQVVGPRVERQEVSQWIAARCAAPAVRAWCLSARPLLVTLRVPFIGYVKQSSLAGFDLDTEPVVTAAVDVDGLELAAVDLVQHGLAGDPESVSGLVPRQPAVGSFGRMRSRKA
jgi:hypothetical protein